MLIDMLGCAAFIMLPIVALRKIRKFYMYATYEGSSAQQFEYVRVLRCSACGQQHLGGLLFCLLCEPHTRTQSDWGGQLHAMGEGGPVPVGTPQLETLAFSSQIREKGDPRVLHLFLGRFYGPRNHIWRYNPCVTRKMEKKRTSQPRNWPSSLLSNLAESCKMACFWAVGA